jgi:hypothetical protein
LSGIDPDDCNLTPAEVEDIIQMPIIHGKIYMCKNKTLRLVLFLVTLHSFNNIRLTGTYYNPWLKKMICEKDFLKV